MYICILLFHNGKRKMQARAIFLNPFTVSQIVICQLADKEINESYTCANGLMDKAELKEQTDLPTYDSRVL